MPSRPWSPDLSAACATAGARHRRVPTGHVVGREVVTRRGPMSRSATALEPPGWSRAPRSPPLRTGRRRRSASMLSPRGDDRVPRITHRAVSCAVPLCCRDDLAVPVALNAHEGHPVSGGPHGTNVRRRPTLPRGLPRSTIGAEGLSFRVRNGTGRFPVAVAAETLWRCGSVLPTVSREPHSGREACDMWSSPRPISTGRLHVVATLPPPAYQPSRLLGALPGQPCGRPHLEASFPLRCFQRLSLPNVANQPCSWRNNWHTRGSSVPVLSY